MNPTHLPRARLRPVALASLAFIAGLAQAQTPPAGESALPQVEVVAPRQPERLRRGRRHHQSPATGSAGPKVAPPSVERRWKPRSPLTTQPRPM